MKEPAQTDPINERVLHRMLVEGLLSSQTHDAALAYAKLHGCRVEDALIDARLLSEVEVLQRLSAVHKTHFVSTQKLHDKQLDASMIALIPKKLALTRGALPIIYDGTKRTLSVATADPDDLVMIEEVKVAAGVRDVIPIVARPAAVRAALARAYENDSSRFFPLIKKQPTQGFSLDIDRSPLPAALQFAPAPAPALETPKAAQKFLPKAPARRGAAQEEEITDADVQSERPAPPAPAPAARPAAPPRTIPISFPMYVETLKVLVGQLEADRTESPGHAAACAELMKRLCDRLKLPGTQASALVLAALLHDVGKEGAHHLTAIVVVEDEGPKAAARELHDAPQRLLRSIGLPPETTAAITLMYERWDGRGFPNEVAGEAIPLGARLLAIVDAYTGLLASPRNARRSLVIDPVIALEMLGRYRGIVFDPSLLDALQAELSAPPAA